MPYPGLQHEVNSAKVLANANHMPGQLLQYTCSVSINPTASHILVHIYASATSQNIWSYIMLQKQSGFDTWWSFQVKNGLKLTSLATKRVLLVHLTGKTCLLGWLMAKESHFACQKWSVVDWFLLPNTGVDQYCLWPPKLNCWSGFGNTGTGSSAGCVWEGSMRTTVPNTFVGVASMTSWESLS